MVKYFQLFTRGDEEICYLEIDGRFACRQFLVCGSHISVAPYDMPFVNDLGKLHVREAPVEITLVKFQSLWEEFAQKRLRELSTVYCQGVENPFARYFRAILSPDEGDFGSAVWLAEFAGEITRRQFEIYERNTLVAPYDLIFAEHFDIIESDSRYEEVVLAEFESLWEEFANRRFQELARTNFQAGK